MGIIRVVGDLQGYTLVTDTHAFRAVEGRIGIHGLRESYGCLFIKDGEGSNISVYGCVNYIPWLTALVYQIK